MTIVNPPIHNDPQRSSGAACCALFLAAPAPGQVYRFLERRSGRTPEQRARLNALGLLLSEPVGQTGLRAITGAGPGLREFFEAEGRAFAAAFAATGMPVTLLYTDAGAGGGDPSGTEAWGWCVWTAGADGEVAEEAFAEAVARSAPGLGARLLAGLIGARASGDGAAVRARAWARKHELPVGRVPGLSEGRAVAATPLVDYATVAAALDQKNLLLEDSPRLYRLRF